MSATSLPCRTLRRPVLICLVVISAFLACATSSTADLATPPRISGDLRPSDESCERERNEFTHVRILRCEFDAYSDSNLDPAAERWYFVDWIQITARPLEGWCIRSARGSIQTDGSEISDWTPRFLRERRAPRIELQASPGELIGVVAKNFRRATGRTSTTVGDRPRGDRFDWRYEQGARANPARIVLGVGKSVQANPSGLISTGMTEQFNTEPC